MLERVPPLTRAPLNHPHQHKYNKDDYYYNYNSDYPRHRFASLPPQLIILYSSPEIPQRKNIKGPQPPKEGPRPSSLVPVGDSIWPANPKS